MKVFVLIAFLLSFSDNIYIRDNNPPYPCVCWEDIDPKIFYIVEYEILKVDSLNRAIIGSEGKEVTYTSIDTFNYREAAKKIQNTDTEILFY